MKTLRPALVLLVFFSALTGLLYPLVITGTAALLFPKQAHGQPELVGQAFTQPRYFHGRPSAANYDAQASSGSNLGPSNPALTDAVKARVAALAVNGPVPVDLVTTSGSGLDPHISPAAARVQLERVAVARGMKRAELEKLLSSTVEHPWLGVLGEPRVNVLRLNLALDALPAQ